MNNKPKKTEIRLFEAFAGIGSQFQALKNISAKKNWTITSVGIIEWFIPAIIAYNAIHYTPKKIKKESFNDLIVISSDSKKPVTAHWYNTNTQNSTLGFWLNQSSDVAHNLFDISKVKGSMVPKNIDIFTYSFPCQDISHQGLQKGFAQHTNTRSGLLWQVDRILTEIAQMGNKSSLPKYLLLENVKAIINSKHEKSFNSWLQHLNDLGYESQQYVLNASNFNSCQNRERVFVLSVLKSHKIKTHFEFPHLQEIKQTNKKPLKSILENNLNFMDKYNHYQLSQRPYNRNTNVQKYYLHEYTNFASENYVFDINHSGTTLTASGAMSRIKLYYGPNQIREMTPYECFSYMGFHKSVYAKIIKYTDITTQKQIYLCGNSIVVNVLEAIFKSLVF